MTIFSQISEIFWSPKIWLPPNITWADIAPGSREDVNHADFKHLICLLPLAAVLIIIRYVVEIYWFAPIGRALGIKSTLPKKPSPNPILEAAYNQNYKQRHKIVLGLTKQVDMTERQIERWWRMRRAQDKPSTLVKFCENCWRCLFYTFSFMYGVIVLWDKPWFWDIKYCWYGYPHHSVESGIWWYIMISISFYLALFVTQFFDIKRKDFWQMFAHHAITLLLMEFGWVCNYHRMGSLLLVVHDCADIFLEAAKIAKYANYQKVCDCIFALFTIVWIVTRLGIFPLIIYSSSVEALRIIPTFPAYYIFNSLLILLLCLHIAWTYAILQIAQTAIKSGLTERDIRSSSSDDISDSSENRRPNTNV